MKYIPVEEIEDDVRDMFISVEDHRFYEHIGVCMEYMLNAYRSNERAGYVKFGGSTITQQLARNLFLVPDRSYLRKYMEIISAMVIELVLGKKRILELYINYIEMGKGVFGLGAASEYYYSRTIHEIDYEQIARIVAILPNPVKYSVKNLFRNFHMKQRYDYLVSVFCLPE